MKRLLAVFVSLFFLSGCVNQQGRKNNDVASGTPSDNILSKPVEPEARNLFNPAEAAFNNKQYDEAARGFRLMKSRFTPKTRAHMVATYRLGTIFYYKGNYTEAQKEFEYFLGRYPNSEVTFDVTYNLAACHYQNGSHTQSRALLQKIANAGVREQGSARAEIVYQLMGLNAEALGNFSEAVLAFAAQLQFGPEDSVRSQTENHIATNIKQIEDPGELDRLYSDVTEPWTRSQIRERLARNSAPQEVSPGALASLPEISGASPPPAQVSLGSGSSADKYHIGVLLPLTGKFAAYGRKALDGILLASRPLHANRAVDFQLFIEDTASNPVTAEEGAERLVEEHNVSAIIGPIQFREAVAVANRAQELGVMNISLTAREGISSQSPYLFQNAMTPRVQMENLAQFATQERKFKRFAILYPQSAYGKDMAAEFWTAVEKNGGRVVSYIGFPPDEKDFQKYIQELVGVGNPRFRRMEFAALAEYAKNLKPNKSRKTRVELPPIIDFDAIFIPDSPKTIGQLAGSLAYYNVKGIPLLGTAEWNTDQLYKRGGKMVEGAVFPGGLSMNSKSELSRDFLRGYAEAFGIYPDLLSAQAYEAMLLASQAIQTSGSDNRNDIVNKLANVRDFSSPLGELSFDSSRIAKRKLSIFELGPGGSITEQ